jgi:hypothetical protein
MLAHLARFTHSAMILLVHGAILHHALLLSLGALMLHHLLLGLVFFAFDAHN